MRLKSSLRVGDPFDFSDLCKSVALFAACSAVRFPKLFRRAAAVSGKRFIVHADEKLTAFLKLEAAIHAARVD